MRRSVIEATCWWPLIQVTGWVILYRFRQEALLPVLGMVASRYSAVYVWDPATLRFTYADPESEEMTGYTPEQLYDMRVPDLSGRPCSDYDSVSHLLVQGIAARVKLTSWWRHGVSGLWHPVMARCSLLVTEESPPQILHQARVMEESEVTAQSCTLSVT